MMIIITPRAPPDWPLMRKALMLRTCHMKQLNLLGFWYLNMFLVTDAFFMGKSFFVSFVTSQSDMDHHRCSCNPSQISLTIWLPHSDQFPLQHSDKEYVWFLLQRYGLVGTYAL